MKKVLIIIGVVALCLATPILGMSISPTRSLLLGLAPDEQILTLADQIDENRISSEQKMLELQSTIDVQQAELEKQQQMIDNAKLETGTAIKNAIVNNTNSEKKEYCDSKIKKYTDKIAEAKKDKKDCDDSEVKYGKGCKELAESAINDFEKLLEKTKSECKDYL